MHTTNLPQEIAQKLSKEREHTLLKLGEELQEVNKLSFSLFPKTYHLDTQATERFRSMAILSRCSLNLNKIESHRPLVGPLIVSAKKLLFKMLLPLIQPTLTSIEQCFSELIFECAALESRNSLNKADKEQSE